MKSILIVGSGGREHALVRKLRQSPDVGRIWVAPGNAGTASIATNVPLAATDCDGLVAFVQRNRVDLTVIGPEAPLALGLAGALRSMGAMVVGPDRAAARIEWSKSFAKELMARVGVPTAEYRVFNTPIDALVWLREARYPMVIKADGLAAGKGVRLCADEDDAVDFVKELKETSAAGKVLIEEVLHGPEISLLAFADGSTVVTLPVAQDHKRLGDGDTGQNTGGMGAYAPYPGIEAAERVAMGETLLQPIVTELARLGTPFRGILFAGVMLTADGPRVLEYNCRFGDPETQVILPLLDGDLLPWLLMIACGHLRGALSVSAGAAVGVVLAARGYPDRPQTGETIGGLDETSEGVVICHGGTALGPTGEIVTAGGRVLTVVGTGSSIDEAASRAYDAGIRFDGMQRRQDIGWQARAPRSVPSLLSTHHGLPRIGVLASGDGSNLQVLLDASRAGLLEAEIAVVISHNPDAGALRRASRAGVSCYALTLLSRRDPDVRHAHERAVLRALDPFQLDLIVLAGWMLILSQQFLEQCKCPVINVHPALLDPPAGIPVLRGRHAVRDALALGLPYTGVTVHSVTAAVDCGPVVLSERVPIVPGDDEERLYKRIKAVEHRLLPTAVTSCLTLVPGEVYA